MRRLASVVPLRYGCAIGREIGSEVNQHDKQWQIDPDRVREMVQAAVADTPDRNGRVRGWRPNPLAAGLVTRR